MLEVNKNELNVASQGNLIPPFTGWTMYGYYLNGILLNHKPGMANWCSWPEVKKPTAEDRALKRAAWREQCKHASISRQETLGAIESHLGYSVPTLDQVGL